MLAKVILQKTDNGYKASIIDWDTEDAVRLGTDIMNRGLKGFKTGDLVYAIVNITPVGRRTLKKAWLKKSPLSETTLLEKRLAPAAIVNGWLNKEQTEVHRRGVPVSVAAPSPVLYVAEEDGDLESITEEEEEKVVNETPSVRWEGEEEEQVEEVQVDPLDGYYLDHQSRLVFSTAHRMSEAAPERAVKVMMVGPSGYGKTTLPRLFAKVTGREFLRMNCATIRDPEEWFGYREAVDGSTVFIRSQFAKAIEKGNLVVVLDEFNRLEPWLHNTLFPLLDDDGKTVVHEEEFCIGPNVVVVGTINNGFRYTGTFELDEALLNRFDFLVEVGPMPHLEEVSVLCKRTGIQDADANLVVKMCNILRQEEVVASTRTSLLVASMVRSGMTIRDAFESAVVRRIPQDTGGGGLRKKVIDLINVEFGNYQDSGTVNGDVFTSTLAPTVELPKTRKPTLYIRHQPGRELVEVNAIRALRSLPIEGGDKYTVREAQAIVRRVQQGEEVVVQLSGRPKGLTTIIDQMKHAGLSGLFKANA